MLIQVNHDNHIQGSAGLTQAIRAIIEGQLARFGEQITRVEVQLSDEAGAAKSGTNDKRCMLEARLAGMEPVSVTDRGNTVDQSVRGASRKMESLLESSLGKLNRRQHPVSEPESVEPEEQT